MKKLLLLLTAIAACSAQTATTINQIKAAPAPSVQLVGITTAGRLIPITLGPGLAISSSGQISIVAMPVPTYTIEQIRLTQVSGNYAVPDTPGFVTRGGAVQEAGKDYMIQDGKLMPNALFGAWAPDDVVILNVVKPNGANQVSP